MQALPAVAEQGIAGLQMAKRYAVKSPKGDFRFFTTDPEESKKRFMDTKPFGEEWRLYRSLGYAVVQVDIRVTSVLD
ncbi:TPA: hypothetical protein QHA87_003345 [Aeromonas dhakensis]|jgi:hypothetical protein|nr:hypothetical protein [Aeromonas dhakensis]HEB4980343.1 hypothetical protein [Aeromonas dhakensis]